MVIQHGNHLPCERPGFDASWGYSLYVVLLHKQFLSLTAGHLVCLNPCTGAGHIPTAFTKRHPRFYSGFRRKAQVTKCKRFGRQKGGHGSRRSMHRPWKLGTRNATLLALCNRMRCFVKKVLARIAPYTFISHTKMSIVFRKGRSTNYIA